MSSFKKDVTSIGNSLLTGEKFNTGPYDVSPVTWSNAPDPAAEKFKGCSGSGMVFDGVPRDQTWFNQLTVGNEYTLMVFPVDLKSTSGYYAEEIVVRTRITTNSTSPAGGPWIIGELKVYARVYHDEHTATETLISYNSTGWALGGARYDYMHSFEFCVANFVKNSTNYIFIGACAIVEKTNLGTYSFEIAGQALPFAKFLNMLDGTIPVIEESPEFGPASVPEGYTGGGGAGGSTAFDDHSDTIDIPTEPMSILGLGFINIYKCDASSLTDFGAALFPDITFPSSLSDVGEVLAAFAESIWNNKLIDYVISVHCVPTNVPAGNLTNIKIGSRTMTTINGRPVTSEYVNYSFGDITIDEYYHNYADYMCRFTLYLPFYGFVSLKPEEILGGKISVDYRFNIIDGSFIAYVRCTSARSKMKNSIIGQYGGSAIVHLPVSNLSYSSMFSSMIGGASSAAAGYVTGNAGAIVAGALTEASGIASALQGGDVKKSNSYNASASFMTRRRPYIIVERPYSSFSTKYNEENGLPSNIVYPIGACVGFTQATNAILDGIPCTADEKNRLQTLLGNGIIIKEISNE